MTLKTSRSAGGKVGFIVTADDVNGTASPEVVDATVLIDSSGAEKGTAANPLVTSSSSAAVTPAAATASVVTTGGTAVTVVAGPIAGGFVTNPANAARQAIATAEPLYIDLVGTPLSTEAGANGTTTALDPGQTFVLPALKAGVSVKVNAATSLHKFTAEVW